MNTRQTSHSISILVKLQIDIGHLSDAKLQLMPTTNRLGTAYSSICSKLRAQIIFGGARVQTT